MLLDGCLFALLKVWTVNEVLWDKAQHGSTRALMDGDLTRKQEQSMALNTSAMQSSQTLQLIDHTLNDSLVFISIDSAVLITVVP